MLSAGAPVPVPLLRHVQQVLPAAELHTPYGMTEALPVTDIALPEIEKAGAGNGVCVGRAAARRSTRDQPARHAWVGLTAAADRPVEVTGEICVVGSTRQGPLRPAVGDRAGTAPVTRAGTAPAMSATSTPPGGCGSRAGWPM